jgi:hypothetical protein
MIALLFLFGFSQAQTVVFNEDFESLPLNVTSSGSSNWARSNVLAANGSYSDTARITAANDTTILTTNSFSTSNYSHVLLQFNHIAKVALMDGGYLEVSTDNGSTWTRLGHAEYRGYGYLGSAYEPKFNVTTYAGDWDFLNATAVPDNSWWRLETFDLSYLAANSANVKVRFVLYGSTTNYYGWLLDDIEVKVSNSELVPPHISLDAPYPQDTVFNTGPFNINATITDSSGVMGAKLVYSVNNGAYDTIVMTAPQAFPSNFSAAIPAQSYGTHVCYFVLATDSLSNSGSFPAGSCIEFVTAKDPNAPPAFHYDVAIHSVISPEPVAIANVNSPVNIRIVNRGDSILTKAKIGWEFDGQPQSVVNWTGSLTEDLMSDTINLGTKTYSFGSHEMRLWAYDPNDSTDQNTANDTLVYNFYACGSILSGTYTLGGSGSDFTDFADLMNAINNCGLNGPTVVKVKPGYYNEQFVLGALAMGVDSVNTLTIESFTGNNNDVILYYQPVGGDFVVQLDSISGITFKNITIKALDNGSINNAVKIMDNASNISFTGCRIIAPYSTNTLVYGVVASGDSIRNLSFTGNEFIGGNTSVKIKGSYNKYLNSIILNNNSFSGFYKMGMDISYTNYVTVNANDLQRDADVNNSGALNGISLIHVDGLEVRNNRIALVAMNSSYGINISYSSTLNNQQMVVANNMISLTGNSASTSFMGIKTYNVSDMGIFHNSVAIHSGSTTSGTAFYVSGSGTTNLDINNNIFANFHGGLSFVRYGGTMNSINYNDYYTTGLVILKWSYSQSASTSGGIAGVQALTGGDTNSVVADPMFYSASNLHAFGSAINDSGMVISSVTTDIDGDPRSTTTPDIGADEFSIAAYDAGVLSLISPALVDTQANVVPYQLIIKNFGSSTITSMPVKHSFDGSAYTTYNYTGSLATGQSDTITVGTVNVPFGNYQISAYTALSGDTLNYNDTIDVQLEGRALVELQVVELISPETGCGKTGSEEVTVKVINNGVGYIYNGTSLSYSVNGGSMITENISDTIAPGASFTYTFNAKADIATGYTDSAFNFTLVAHNAADPVNINDTSYFGIVSLANLVPPTVTDTTITYGDTAILFAASQYPVFWYENDSVSTPLGMGNYVTPHLFDTTTYYAQASLYNPPATGVIGTGSSTLGPFDKSPYGGNLAAGRYQILYTAAELSAAGITAGYIESIAFNVATAFNAPSASFEISMANVPNSSLTSTFLNPGFTLVYSTTFTGVAGWNTHNFSTPFYWDGSSNLLIQVCTNGNPYNAAPMYYTNTTTTMMVGAQGMGTSCASATGGISSKRPNIKIVKSGSTGCYSARVPKMVNVPPPAIEARVLEITEPKDGCGLVSTPVTIAIENKGTSDITSNFTVTYKINNGSYITPETVTTDILSGDTLFYTFNTLASLPPGAAGTKYVITAKVTVTGDGYTPNDELASDSIMSYYTPANPVVSSVIINHGALANLTATAADSVYWYTDTLGLLLSGEGHNFTSPALYDTTVYYAQTQRTIPTADYTVGNGTSTTSQSDPSPYGAGSYSGWGQRTQFLIRADELKALGMIQGPIYSLSFYVVSPVGISMNGYTIRMGHTNATDMAGTYFLDNLTTVYTSNAYTENAAWNTHTFSAPFYWDGESNIVVETCFKNNANISYSTVQYTNTSYTSVGYDRGYASWSCSDAVVNFNSTKRPNIRFNQKGLGVCKSDLIPDTVYVINTPQKDAAILAFSEPVGSASSATPSPVKVVISNYGLSNLTAASINWTENGVAQTAVSWTGNLAKGETDTVVLAAAHNFMGGTTELKAWIGLSGDTILTNDTTILSLPVCMSGTYVINAAGNGNYTGFNDAINDMENVGVCGPVVFNVDSAIYTEKVEIYPIPGVDATNTITFQSTQMDSSKVTLTHTTSQASNYVIRLSGVRHISFKYLGFKSNGSKYANIFDFANGAGDIEFLNNYFEGSSTTSYSSIASAIYSKYGNTNNFVFKNNYVKNNYTAIYFYGSSTDSLTNFVFENNVFDNFVRNGLELRYVNNIAITGNTFTSNSVYSSNYGIYTAYNKDGLVITNNRMALSPTNYAYGIYMFGAKGTAVNYVNISNNFISVLTGTGSSRGLYFSSCDYMNVVFNSINLYGGGQGNSALYSSSGSYHNVKNNNFAVYKGYAMYVTTMPTSSQHDYNNLWVDPQVSTYFVKWVTAHASLSVLKAYDTNNNQHCVSVDPQYYTTTDLHTNQTALYKAGITISGFTTDIDGDPRNTTAPTIGADEIIPPAIDLGITNMVSPAGSSCGFTASDSIVINIVNNGLNNLNFASINATVTVYIAGISTDTIVKTLNSGTLNSGDDMDVVVSSNYNFATNGQYIISAEVFIAGDGNAQNDNMPSLTITSYPNISSFPFSEDFESGINISFKEEVGLDAGLTVASSAAYTSTKGLHFEGGSYSGWYNPANVTAAFANVTHVASAKTCNVDATSMNALSLQFDLRQTKYSPYINGTSWFRVILIDANNNMHYLKNSQGDSVFVPQTTSADPWVRQTFSLNQYVGQNFQIVLQSANKYSYNYGTYLGDNAFVDNIYIGEPSQYDVAMKEFVNTVRHAEIGDSLLFSIIYANYGTDTLYTIPVAYRVGSGAIVHDTINTVLAPTMIDTFTFSQPYAMPAGLQQVCVFGELTNDGNPANDTICVNFMGMDTYYPTYSDGFELKTDWFAEGSAKLWVQGTPNKANITGAYSGQKAWVTGLSQNYPTDAEEYVYSPYFRIPSYANTATMEFYLFVDVSGTNAYGQLEYSVDKGASWHAYGYMGAPGSVNWYNTQISGDHVWAMSNSGWNYTKIPLDSLVFNTGNSFQLRFKFKSDVYNVSADGIAFDDFKISIPKAAQDAGVKLIVNPAGSTVTGDSIQVEVLIRNYGSDTLTGIPVSYMVDGTVIATETWTGIMPSDSIKSFTFSTKYAAPGSDYNICAYTQLAGDMVLFNDTACAMITATPGAIDAGVSSVIAPSGQSSIGQPTEVKVYITNFGTNALTNIPVEYYLNGILKASETFSGTINPGDSALYTFTYKYISGSGLYTICAQTAMTADVNSANDRSCVSIVGTSLEGAEQNMFRVSQNQPNPAQSKTTIDFYIPKGGNVEFKIVNMLGSVVEQSDVNYSSGKHQIIIDANELDAGVYYYTLTFDGETKTFKMIVVR